MDEISFTRFPDLPPEIRLKIWDEAAAGTSMHVFDVCFPSWRDSGRSKRAFRGAAADGAMSKSDRDRWTKYSECVFLDALEVGPAELARRTRVARHANDPSAYRLHSTMRLTCSEASAAVQRRTRGKRVNTVYLPGKNRKIEYDNDDDVLFLRFRDGGAITSLTDGVLLGEFEASGMNDLTELLAVVYEEVAYLACCLQQGLRVLYLVDHCHGRCTRCKRHDARSDRLQTRGPLYRQLQGRNDAGVAMARAPEVIHGVGKTYREVFDLEGLGWSHEHPNYVFAAAMDEMIRSQQADADKQDFEGVRVLLVEDEEVEGVDTTMLVDCSLDGASEWFPGQAMNMRL
ncbi:hypothetical protein LY76DRAFT_618084 [Colletotrichum caudatum]|nr:hypothetical protein LY76DRAFT_618084 [Colletotrichum caudatum]